MINTHQISFKSSSSYISYNKLSPKTESIWFVFHGYGQLSRYFIRRFDVLDKEKNYIIAPQGLSKFYLDKEYKNVGASWLTHEENEMDLLNQQNYLTELFNELKLEIDFSKIKVKNLTVTNAKNDCVDFSYGEYFVEKLTVNNCQDKGISIGEKSIFNSISVETNDTNISLVSKDASKTNIKNLNITKTNLCLAAYVKKKEFSGALINIQNTNCETNDFIDAHSKINYE